MTYLFIADLHLSPNHPRLVRGFLALLEHYQNKNTQLYILGDWFNAWIGDDYHDTWLTALIDALKAFTDAGNHIYFLVGNRDFALGQTFLKQFNGVLLPETHYIQIQNTTYRLEHGDLLCTDDVSYQRFRKIIRHPLVLGTLKKTPLFFRQKIANGFRNKSVHAKQEKNYSIMDVNKHAVSKALATTDILIHGHTHRPYIHQNISNKPRIVLGDWRENTGEAMILEISNNNIQHFFSWTF